MANYNFILNIFIDSKIATFEIRKINANQLLKSDIHIPTNTFNMHSTISLNDMIYISGGKKSFCVGKIRYPSDYMSGELNTNEIYELIVLQIDTNNHINRVNVSDITRQRNFDIKIPYPQSVIENNQIDKLKVYLKCNIISGKNCLINFCPNYIIQQCENWIDNGWSSSMCTKISNQNNYIHCKCDWVGYFRFSIFLYCCIS